MSRNSRKLEPRGTVNTFVRGNCCSFMQISFTGKFSERIKRTNSENTNLLLVFCATFCQCLTSLAGVRSSTFARTLAIFPPCFSSLSTRLFNLSELSRHSVSTSLFIHLSVVAGQDQREHLDVALGKGQHHPFTELPSRYNSPGRSI